MVGQGGTRIHDLRHTAAEALRGPAGPGLSGELFRAINKLLDEDPRVAPGGNVYQTNPVFFDTIGRRVRLGARFSF